MTATTGFSFAPGEDTTKLTILLQNGRKIRTGNFSQNRMRLAQDLCFGGFKESGFGRAGGAAGLSEYLESKMLLLD